MLDPCGSGSATLVLILTFFLKSYFTVLSFYEFDEDPVIPNIERNSKILEPYPEDSVPQHSVFILTCG